MKLLICTLILFTQSALAVCLVPITRDNINPGQVPTSTAYNSDFDNLYDRANTVPGNCLLELSLRAKQFADGSIGTTKIADASVTAVKLATGALPSFEKPIRIRAFTISGKWKKLSDVKKILVLVIGGGGGSGSSGDTVLSGGASSFGSFCSASGGSFGKDSTAGAGGTGSSGDINLPGESGERSFLTPVSKGGRSMIGSFGQGGHGDGNAAGGGGGFCMKIISRASLADEEIVTVGAGGAGSPLLSPKLDGKSGIVLIYEFGE